MDREQIRLEREAIFVGLLTVMRVKMTSVSPTTTTVAMSPCLIPAAANISVL